MPYQLPDPRATRVIEPATRHVTLSAEEKAAIGIADPAAKLIDELRPPILAAQAEEDAASAAAVQATDEFRYMREAGLAVRDLFRKRDAQRALVEGKESLSRMGKDAGVERVDADLRAGLERLARLNLGQHGDALLRKFPASPVPVPSGDVASAATFIFTAAPVKLPGALLAEAADVLRIATDLSVPPADRFRLNILLDAAYLPVLQRFAGAPPKHWAALAHLASELAALIEVHIATTWQRARHALATEAVAGFRKDFSWLVASAMQSGKWSDVLLDLGTPRFAGTDTLPSPDSPAL